MGCGARWWLDVRPRRQWIGSQVYVKVPSGRAGGTFLTLYIRGYTGKLTFGASGKGHKVTGLGGPLDSE